MTDLIKRLGWVTSLSFSAALLLAGCGGEPGDMDDDGVDETIEVIEPSPEGVPSTDMDDMGGMPAPSGEMDMETPVPEPTPTPEPEIESTPTPEPEIEPAPEEPGTEEPAPEQP
ncbi:hypothetical protein [Tautonia plasticadhaerens]|uniref:Uncharacterized protein n=1 Tax=Tautonia plasticadhaerens TaxID=2527974 RepID=A0A518HCY3_9BACT|nr:hypothetical protein [Tautonia plasticadhaerens]QDV38715.1 hypothetical protein ElP_66700 [Tautonia plasticadhaerens]